MEKQKVAISEKSKKIIESFPQAVKKFYSFHGVQMIGSAFPIELVELLYNKLNKQIYDASEYFQITDNQQKQTFQVKAKQKIKQNSQVFIVDHALTFRYSDLRKILKQNPKIIPRLQVITKYLKQYKPISNKEQQKKAEQEVAQQQANQLTKMELQFEEMQLEQIGHLQFPPNTVTLSLMNNNITCQKQQQFIKKLEYLSLKVLWVNGNPIQQSPALKQYVENKTKIQIFNSKLTKNCGPWGLKYASNRNVELADDPILQSVYKLNLDGRDIFNIDLTNLHKFKNLSSLSLKEHSMTEQKSKQAILWILNQLKSLKYLYVDLEVQRKLFEMVQAKQLSLEVANRILVNKHSLLLSPAPQELDQEIDEIQRNIFKIAGCYRLASSQQLDESSIWYVNDELGSMIPHSDDPNIKLMPFLYAPNNKLDESVQAYSIFWPVKDIEHDNLSYRDYLNGIKQQRQRSHRLAIWYKMPQKYYGQQIKNFDDKMFDLQKNSISVLQKFYANNAIQQRLYIQKISEDDSFFLDQHKVITDNPFVLQYLKSEKFKIVQSLEEATIIWLTGAAEEEQWEKYKGKYFLNQFPFQSCVVMKHNLADTVQSVFGDTKFLMRTYNLQTQLKQMIGDFYERQNKSKDNLWIIKPPNMARSMDMIITDNISNIIKSMQTGPKIAQKYISKPVLRQSRKVDLRYILLVRSISPLTLYLYKHFWIRSSNNPYTVDRRALNTYQTQFTVMNYNKVSDFKQIPYKSFIQDFQKSYAPVKWSTINDKIKKMLRNVFIACGLKYPQMQEDKCRAVYGIDIMIDQENMQPKLLQITFSPDCKRACEYYPTFYNQIFQTLYMDVVGQNMERII